MLCCVKRSPLNLFLYLFLLALCVCVWGGGGAFLYKELVKQKKIHVINKSFLGKTNLESMGNRYRRRI